MMSNDFLSVNRLNQLIDDSTKYNDVDLESEIINLRKTVPSTEQQPYIEILLKVVNKEDLDYSTRENAIFTLSYWQPKGFKELLFDMMKNNLDIEMRAIAIHFYTAFYMSGTKDKTLLNLLYGYVKDVNEEMYIRTHAVEGMMYVFYGKDNMTIEERGHWRSFANYPIERLDSYESRIPWDELDKIMKAVS